MAQKEANAYILGTDRAELYRLGLQHQVWASEAHLGWKKAAFTAGHQVLDLGCGPGFCSKELAFLTGQEGKVIAVDKSAEYIQYLEQVTALHGLNIEAICADFNTMELVDNSLDGMYCRWALAWLPNPEAILEKVLKALKTGGKMVIHEYYDWSTHQVVPNRPALKKAIDAALRSFKESEGEIDIGRELPRVLEELGMKITSIRPLVKLATPSDLTWQWPKSFYETYFPKLVDYGYLTTEEAHTALSDINVLEKQATSTILCPMMVEIIAEKG